MKLFKVVAISAVFTILSLTIVSAQQAETEPTAAEKAYEYRADVMHVLSAQRNVMRDMADAKRETDSVTFINAANALAALAKMIPEAFTINAIAAESAAKPDIWTNWDDFVARANKLSDTVSEIARVAANDLESAKGLAKNIRDCGGCHDDYRVDDN